MHPTAAFSHYFPFFLLFSFSFSFLPSSPLCGFGMATLQALHFLLVSSLVINSFAAIGPVTDLAISDANISPDGYERAAVVAGGSFPGPLITGQKGDHFQINVVDQLTNHTMLKSTSIVSTDYTVAVQYPVSALMCHPTQHWHGFFQKGTNWADGPAFVNQCPIATGHSFLYDFSAPDQAGESANTATRVVEQ